jgi:hypothetical protein
MEEKTLRLQWEDDSADEYEVRDECLYSGFRVKLWD